MRTLRARADVGPRGKVIISRGSASDHKSVDGLPKGDHNHVGRIWFVVVGINGDNGEVVTSDLEEELVVKCSVVDVEK